MFWGCEKNRLFADSVLVRDPSYFNWTFIALLALVFYVYWTEIERKNYKAVIAGAALYAVHWFYEIVNAIIAHFSGYALWTVTNESSSFVLLIGVSWELSMMFSIAGIIAFKMIPTDVKKRIIGLDIRLAVALSMALLFSVVEVFLAWTPAFIWVYPWWGAVPVFITTYVPFFLAACFVPFAKPAFQKVFLCGLIGLDLILLCTLIPFGII